MKTMMDGYSQGTSGLMMEGFQMVDEVIAESSGKQLEYALEIRRLLNELYTYGPGELASIRQANNPQLLQAKKTETQSRIGLRLEKIDGMIRFYGGDDRLKNAKGYFDEALKGAVNDAVAETRATF